MAVDTSWSGPTVASSSTGLDLPTGATLTETIIDRYASNLYRLGGTDGNAKTGKYMIGGTTYSNANNSAGLTVNQAAADDEAYTAKSSDVATGITDHAETDTYWLVKKAVDASGGVTMRGLTEATIGVWVQGMATTEDTAAKSTSSTGGI